MKRIKHDSGYTLHFSEDLAALTRPDGKLLYLTGTGPGTPASFQHVGASLAALAMRDRHLLEHGIDQIGGAR